MECETVAAQRQFGTLGTTSFSMSRVPGLKLPLPHARVLTSRQLWNALEQEGATPAFRV
jgi:hypothetical protein